MGKEACGQDAGVVADQGVGGTEKLRKVGEKMVGDLAGGAVDDEEARLISPCGGLLSHEMRRQRVVEKVGGERHGLEKTVFEACPCAKGEFLPLFRGMPS